jgi:hypothetical protein
LSIPVALRRGMLVLKSPGQDEQVTHPSLLVKPVMETIIVDTVLAVKPREAE